MDDGKSMPGYVSLDEVGNGAPYILRAGEGEHVPVRSSLRTLLTRSTDTEGNFGMTFCEGDAAPWTPPHLHHNTTEGVYVLNGSLRVWQDNREGKKIVTELFPGDFGLLPTGWAHSWAFNSPKTQFLAFYAPAGFEGIMKHLDPHTAPTAQQLSETQERFDVVWMPDYPIVDESEQTGA